MPEFEHYHTQAEIQEVIHRFEDCKYKPEEFFHARHLTVAAWYFLHLDADRAQERMRAGLRKFITHHGKNSYHVTITEFWLRLVEKSLHEMGPEGDSLSRLNLVVERLNNKSLIYEYYSREQLDTPEAKAALVKPDLKPISDPV